MGHYFFQTLHANVQNMEPFLAAKIRKLEIIIVCLNFYEVLKPVKTEALLAKNPACICMWLRPVAMITQHGGGRVTATLITRKTLPPTTPPQPTWAEISTCPPSRLLFLSGEEILKFGRSEIK